MVDGKNEPHTEKIKVITTASYTLKVPISNNPHYWGLPDLILEINEGNKTVLCSELTLNSFKKTFIEVPKKGEKEFIERFKVKRDDINIQNTIFFFQN